MWSQTFGSLPCTIIKSFSGPADGFIRNLMNRIHSNFLIEHVVPRNRSPNWYGVINDLQTCSLSMNWLKVLDLGLISAMATASQYKRTQCLLMGDFVPTMISWQAKADMHSQRPSVTRQDFAGIWVTRASQCHSWLIVARWCPCCEYLKNEDACDYSYDTVLFTWAI